MSIVFNVATVSFQFVMLGIGAKIPLTIRMLWTFLPVAAVMVIVPFVPNFVEATGSRLGITLALVFLSGMCSAVGFNCIIGLASEFPPEYVGAVMTGQGVAGVVVGVIRIVTKAAYSSNPVAGIFPSTLIYFILACVVEMLCIASYFLLLRLPFAKYHMTKVTGAAALRGSLNQSTEDDSETAGLLDAQQPVTVWGVFKKIFSYCYSVWIVFFVTLSLFPGMTSLIPNNMNDFPHDRDWFGVCNIFIFQVFDFVGRSLPRWFVIIPPRFIWLFSTSRVVFGALFILCIVPNGHPIFASNWASFVIMTFFALTNGYMGTLSMMFAPDAVLDQEKGKAGMIMSVFLQLGIFMAVLFALFILYLVNVCQLPSFLIPAGQCLASPNATAILF